MTGIRSNGDVEFRFFRAQAAAVSIVGEFTQWASNPLRMNRQDDGWWVQVVALPPGDYRFRYLADGEWFTDYASHGIELRKSVWNSVLYVPPIGVSAIHMPPLIAAENAVAPMRIAA